MNEHVNWWTAEQDETILRMIKEGKPASAIGRVIGRTKAAVISRSRRIRERKPAPTSGQKVRFTADDDAIIARMSDEGKSGREIALVLKRNASSVIKRARTIGKPLHAKSGAKRQEPSEGIVIPFPSHRRLPQGFKPAKTAPALRVVSHNIPLMVEDWLKKNGGPRRFEERESADFLSVKDFLEERGVTLKPVRSSWDIKQTRWTVSRGQGRARALGWAGIIAIVDEFRTAEGREPFNAGIAQEPRRLRKGR